MHSEGKNFYIRQVKTPSKKEIIGFLMMILDFSYDHIIKYLLEKRYHITVEYHN